MSEIEPFENQSKVTQVELIRVLDKYDPYGLTQNLSGLPNTYQAYPKLSELTQKLTALTQNLPTLASTDEVPVRSHDKLHFKVCIVTRFNLI